jgi:hypothetical protein
MKALTYHCAKELAFGRTTPAASSATLHRAGRSHLRAPLRVEEGGAAPRIGQPSDVHKRIAGMYRRWRGVILQSCWCRGEKGRTACLPVGLRGIWCRLGAPLHEPLAEFGMLVPPRRSH